jgi:hypothetical protein
LDAPAPVCPAKVADTPNAVTSATTTAESNLFPKTDILGSFSNAALLYRRIEAQT